MPTFGLARAQPIEPVSVDEEQQPGSSVQSIVNVEAPLYDGLDRGPVSSIPPAPAEVESVEYEIDVDDYYGLVQNVRVTTTTAGDTSNATVQAWAQMVAMKIMQDRIFQTWATTGTATTNMVIPANWTAMNSSTTTGWHYIADQCTAAANTVWRSSGWQQCEHAKVRWTPSMVAQETPEQRAERAAKAELARQEREREEAKRKVFIDTAKSRARRLLLSMLNPAQQKQLDEKNHFDLTVHGQDGSQRVYRIEYGYQGNVKLLGPDGQPVRRYCIHADSRLPYEDQMLAQKLLLEANEQDFLRIANMTHLRAA